MLEDPIVTQIKRLISEEVINTFHNFGERLCIVETQILNEENNAESKAALQVEHRMITGSETHLNFIVVLNDFIKEEAKILNKTEHEAAEIVKLFL